MVETKTYYTVELPYNSINSSSWVEYRGEGIGYDWWNSSPIRFNSEKDAIKAISASNDYKDCNWRITRTTIINEVVHECKNS
jgi:hypothetical protein